MLLLAGHGQCDSRRTAVGPFGRCASRRCALAPSLRYGSPGARRPLARFCRLSSPPALPSGAGWHGWSQGRDLLSPRDVLIIDEAGTVGTRQMERVPGHAAEAGTKVVLVDDPQQLQAIEAGAAFRAAAERHGAIEITEIRRQQEGWQRGTTRELATRRTGEAIGRYADAGFVHAADTREDEQRGLARSGSWLNDATRSIGHIVASAGTEQRAASSLQRPMRGAGARLMQVDDPARCAVLVRAFAVSFGEWRGAGKM
ncbi:MAG: AAA family ATPase [Sphingopyxis sp.]|nr:AAA family ATPase [Sphingopyxis sp.]